MKLSLGFIGFPRAAAFHRFASIVFLILGLNACALTEPPSVQEKDGLQETARLVQRVKAFAKTIGIETTDALGRTAGEGRALSMLWVWLQRAGTLASNKPIDIQMAVGLVGSKEQAKIEQIYRVDGYSVYYRQGNEFADARSLVTPSFAAQGIVRRVKVILHEEIHDDANFDLPWDIEEAVVTPIGSLAAIEYFKQQGDVENMGRAQTALSEGKQIARELRELVREAQTIFVNATVEEGKHKVLGLLPKYPAYQRMFERQIRGQHPATVLEAKLSHDLAYYKFFELITMLAEKTPLKVLIEDLKRLPRDATTATTDEFLRALGAKYFASTN